MKKAVLAVIIVILSYTLVDIMIWQRIFETNRMNNFASLYHPGWAVMLACDSALGAILLVPDWRSVLFYLGSVYALAFSGLEDVLYYWLDGRSIPSWLPWLDANPLILFKPVTSTHLLASVSIWVGIWILVLVLFWQWQRVSNLLPRPRHVKRIKMRTLPAALPEPISLSTQIPVEPTIASAQSTD